MNRRKMVPVKDNRAYVKGMGTCVNVDSQAYNARLNKLRAERAKTKRIVQLEDEVSELKDMLNQVLRQQASVNGD